MAHPNPHRPSRRVTAAVVGACACGLAGAAAFAADDDAPAPPRIDARAAAGALELTNSREGAILSGDDLVPGGSVTGSVTLSNRGQAPGALQLAQSTPVDVPGAGGERLSDALRLRVEGGATVVYDGPLSGFTTGAAGTMAPGAERTFVFSVTLPRDAGNGVQAASSSVDFSWQATVVDDVPPPPPPPSDPPARTDPPASTPPPASDPPVAPPPAPEPPPSRSPLTLTLTGAGTQRAAKANVLVSCSSACTLTGRAKITGVKKPGAARVIVPRGQLAAGTSAKLKLKLPRSAALRRALASRKKAGVVVTVTARGAQGEQAVRTLALRLKR